MLRFVRESLLAIVLCDNIEIFITDKDQRLLSSINGLIALSLASVLDVCVSLGYPPMAVETLGTLLSMVIVSWATAYQYLLVNNTMIRYITIVAANQLPKAWKMWQSKMETEPLSEPPSSTTI